MLRNLDDLKHFSIYAADGAVGQVCDFYFDDDSWAMRYFVVDTGRWLFGRKVLITPIAVGKPNSEEKTLPVGITREQVKNSPDIDTRKPVSRQHEIQFLGYYGYPTYWSDDTVTNSETPPVTMVPVYPSNVAAPVMIPGQARFHKGNRESDEVLTKDDIHLRSYQEVVGYHIHATDGDIGHICGMLLDDESWAIHFLIVDTGNWWSGYKVLIAPHWIDQVQWPDGRVTVSLTRNEIRDATPFELEAPVEPPEESGLHRSEDRVGYWVHESKNTEDLGNDPQVQKKAKL